MPVLASERELIDSWLDYKIASEGKAVKTIDKYRGWIERFSDFLGDIGVQLLDANRDHLREFTGMHLFKQKQSASSRHGAVAAVRGFYKYLVDTDVLEKNPAESLVYPKRPRHLPVAMGLKNAEKMLLAPDLSTFIGIRDAAMIAVLVGTGLRVSGLCGLNESDVIQYYHQNSLRMALRVIEKGERERILPVPLDAMILIQAYLGHPELDEVDRAIDNGDRVLFVSVGNRCVAECDYHGEARRLTPNGVLKMFKRYAEECDIPRNEAHPHAVRHLVGAELAEDSVTQIEIKNILGHADVNTSEIYTQLALRKLTDVLDTSNPLAKINSPVAPLIKELRESGQL